MNYRTIESEGGFIGQVWHGGWMNGYWITVVETQKTRLEVNNMLVEHRKMTARR